jgi:hypothetical protein
MLIAEDTHRGIAQDNRRRDDDADDYHRRGSSRTEMGEDVRHRDDRGAGRHGVTFNIGGEYFSSSEARGQGQGVAEVDGSRRQGRREQRQDYESRHRTCSSEHVDTENRERNRGYDNPHSALAVPDFSSYDRQQQRTESASQKVSGKVDYYNRHFGRTGGIHSTDFAERIGSSTATVGGLVGAVSGHAESSITATRKPQGRDQIRYLTEERKRSADACDDHVRSVDERACCFCTEPCRVALST